jgi:hypothetical protein
MTLETIYKLSKALNFELISFPDYKYSHAYSPTISSTISFNDVKNIPLNINLLNDGLFLHSLTSLKIEQSGVYSTSIMQANFLNVFVTTQNNNNG